MERKEEVQTLVYKYGAIEVSRKYIRGIRSALANIRNGIELDNPALAAKDVGLLGEYLTRLETVYGLGEDSLKQIQHLEQDLK